MRGGIRRRRRDERQRSLLRGQPRAAGPNIGRAHISGGSKRVKICKTFALSLTLCIATVDAGFVRFYSGFRFF